MFVEDSSKEANSWLKEKGTPEQHLWLAVVERAFFDYSNFFEYLGSNHNESVGIRLERLKERLTPHIKRGILQSLQELEHFFFGPPQQWTLHYIIDMCEVSDMVMFHIREQVAARYEQSMKSAKNSEIFKDLIPFIEPLKFKTFTVSVYQIDSSLAQWYKVALPKSQAPAH
jgi:hypothetical protein